MHKLCWCRVSRCVDSYSSIVDCSFKRKKCSTGKLQYCSVRWPLKCSVNIVASQRVRAWTLFLVQCWVWIPSFIPKPSYPSANMHWESLHGKVCPCCNILERYQVDIEAIFHLDDDSDAQGYLAWCLTTNFSTEVEVKFSCTPSSYHHCYINHK